MASGSRYLLAAWLLIVSGLAGCSLGIKSGPPTQAEAEQISAGDLAVVLFQVTARVDGKPMPGAGNLAFRFHLANVGNLATPERIVPSSASEAAAAQGWQHLLLPPGTYYLLILPPGMEQNPPAVAFHAPSARFGRLTRYSFTPGRGGFWSPELGGFVFAGPPPPDFAEIPGFWFQVPRNTAAVYLGSVSTNCVGGRGLLGSLIDSCSDYVMTSDVLAAQHVLASMIPRASAVRFVPLLPNGKARDGARLREIGRTETVVRGPVELRAAYTGAELAPWGTYHGVGRSAGILNLFAILAESATRAGAEREAAEHSAQTQACMQALSATLTSIDYSSHLVPRLEQVGLQSARGADAASPASRAGQRLTIDVPIVQLRESGPPEHLALELGVSVRLESAGGDDVLYQSVLFHAAGYPVQDVGRLGLRLYGRLVPERAEPRPETQWCGPDGAALLKRDIEHGLQHIAAQIARDLD
jgi:hypothetical protein